MLSCFAPTPQSLHVLLINVKMRTWSLGWSLGPVSRFAAVCLLSDLLLLQLQLQIPGERPMCRCKSPHLPLSAGEKLFYFFVFTTPACFCVRACVRVGKRVKPFTAGFYRCASPSWCQIKHEPRDQWHAHPCIRAYVWFYCPAGGKSHFS